MIGMVGLILSQYGCNYWVYKYYIDSSNGVFAFFH